MNAFITNGRIIDSVANQEERDILLSVPVEYKLQLKRNEKDNTRGSTPVTARATHRL
jgi:hypothetical protein